jgi:integrase
MAVVDGVRHKLVHGPKDGPHKKLAKEKLREIESLRDKSPAACAAELTVAGVIELYLQHEGKKLGALTLSGRKAYLQSFAVTHGFRKANDLEAKPFHLTSWLDENPQVKRDWTKAHVIAVVHRPFNWAVRQRLIAANPFRGVSHRKGPPRRPMTDAEFEALLAAADAGRRKAAVDRYPSGRKVCPSDRNRRKGPSAAERFRELLRFLRLTGARPGEAAKLRWADIDLDQAVIVLTNHKTSRTQRQPKPRVIQLVPELVQLLVTIRARNEPGEHVFYTHRGTLWSLDRSNVRSSGRAR